MAVRLILVRHGESVLGSLGRYAGHEDTPLSPRGHDQVLKLRSRFQRYAIREIWSSDLVRCRQTAELLASRASVRPTAELRELDFGLWEGLSREEIRKRWRSRYDRWLKDPASITPPRGESLSHLRKRLRRFLAGIADRLSDGTVALITHAGPIRAILSQDTRKFWSIQVPPGSLSVCDRFDRWKGAS